jgi:hypothetical protein
MIDRERDGADDPFVPQHFLREILLVCAARSGMIRIMQSEKNFRGAGRSGLHRPRQGWETQL